MMQNAVVVQDTNEARAERQERAERSNRLLVEVEREGARWANVPAMLSWYYPMREIMTGAQAIDPSKEAIQGGRKGDRDETIAWMGKIGRALLELAVAHEGPHDVALLQLVFRIARENGTKVVDGRRLTAWTDEPVAIRELYLHDRVLQRSRGRCITAFWAAVEELETKALNRRWVAGRVERKTRVEQVYRREQEAAR